MPGENFGPRLPCATTSRLGARQRPRTRAKRPRGRRLPRGARSVRAMAAPRRQGCRPALRTRHAPSVMPRVATQSACFHSRALPQLLRAMARGGRLAARRPASLGGAGAGHGMNANPWTGSGKSPALGARHGTGGTLCKRLRAPGDRASRSRGAARLVQKAAAPPPPAARACAAPGTAEARSCPCWAKRALRSAARLSRTGGVWLQDIIPSSACARFACSAINLLGHGAIIACASPGTGGRTRSRGRRRRR